MLNRPRPFVLSLLTVAAWAIVSGLAIAAFSAQVDWSGHDIVQKEVLGFGYAFSIAGTITGFVALTTFGKWRHAIGFLLAGCVILSVTVPALRLSISRLAGPNAGWARREWDQSIERLVPSIMLGVMVALLLSGPVVVAGLLARRMAPWIFGVLIALIVAILGLGVLPAAISLLADRALPYLRWHHGARLDEALRGAAVGAGPGGLIGAIFVVLVARGLEASTSRIRPTRRTASATSTSLVDGIG